MRHDDFCKFAIKLSGFFLSEILSNYNYMCSLCSLILELGLYAMHASHMASLGFGSL